MIRLQVRWVMVGVAAGTLTAAGVLAGLAGLPHNRPSVRLVERSAASQPAPTTTTTTTTTVAPTSPVGRVAPPTSTTTAAPTPTSTTSTSLAAATTGGASSQQTSTTGPATTATTQTAAPPDVVGDTLTQAETTLAAAGWSFSFAPDGNHCQPSPSSIVNQQTLFGVVGGGQVTLGVACPATPAG